jgi:hypothetical protein
MQNLKEFKTEVQGKIRGNKEGEIKVFKDNGLAKAYNWDGAKNAWQEIGEVMDPSA